MAPGKIGPNKIEGTVFIKPLYKNGKNLVGFRNYNNSEYRTIVLMSEPQVRKLIATDFLDLQNQDSKAGTNILNNVEKLSTFSLASDAIEFSSLLIDVYNSSILVIEEEDLSEAQFRDSIEQIFQ